MKLNNYITVFLLTFCDIDWEFKCCSIISEIICSNTGVVGSIHLLHTADLKDGLGEGEPSLSYQLFVDDHTRAGGVVQGSLVRISDPDDVCGRLSIGHTGDQHSDTNIY